MKIDVTEGATYTNEDKVFTVLKKYGGRVVLLPKDICTGFELPPIVLGDKDLNFFKKLTNFDVSFFDEGIKNVRIDRLKKKIISKKIELRGTEVRRRRCIADEAVLSEEIQELEDTLEELITPQSVKFIREEE